MYLHIPQKLCSLSGSRPTPQPGHPLTSRRIWKKVPNNGRWSEVLQPPAHLGKKLRHPGRKGRRYTPASVAKPGQASRARGLNLWGWAVRDVTTQQGQRQVACELSLISTLLPDDASASLRSQGSAWGWTEACPVSRANDGLLLVQRRAKPQSSPSLRAVRGNCLPHHGQAKRPLTPMLHGLGETARGPWESSQRQEGTACSTRVLWEWEEGGGAIQLREESSPIKPEGANDEGSSD